jgi:hypothetical protein
MGWVLDHTHLPGLDTLQSIGAGIALTVGYIAGKALINFTGRVLQGAINHSRK